MKTTVCAILAALGAAIALSAADAFKMDLSQLSDEDLIALSKGDLSSVSDSTLVALANGKMSPRPSSPQPQSKSQVVSKSQVAPHPSFTTPMDNATASILGSLLGSLFGVAVGISLGAVLVQFATKWLAGFKPPYGMACLAVFLACVASFGVGLVVGFAVAMNKEQMAGIHTVFILVAGFFAQAGFYSFMLKSPEGVTLGFGKACLVSMIQTVIAAIAVAVIALLIAGAVSVSRG